MEAFRTRKGNSRLGYFLHFSAFDVGSVASRSLPIYEAAQDHLAVRQAQQQPLVHALSEQQGAFLGTGGLAQSPHWRKRSTALVMRVRRERPSQRA